MTGTCTNSCTLYDEAVVCGMLGVVGDHMGGKLLFGYNLRPSHLCLCGVVCHV